MIVLTEAVLASAYDLLRATAPFHRWKMPPASDIKFKVLKTKNYDADCNGEVIRVSTGRHSSLAALLPTMAHEMVHLHQMSRGTFKPKSPHDSEFKRLLALVCKHHGFDAKAVM